MSNNIYFVYQYVGPSLYGLLPISIISMTLILYISVAVIRGQKVNLWAEIFLAYIKEISTLLGMMGTIYAIAMSFQIDDCSAEMVRKKMFHVLSTGFWSTIAGIMVSIESSIGLLILKKV